jgi:CRISPR-associated protein Csd1
MILKALADYYERLANDPSVDVAPYGFEYKAIPFLIVIGRDGRFLNVRDTRQGEGKERLAREFCLPRGEKKSSGIKANLLWDNPQYVLGASKSDTKKDVKKAHDALNAFECHLTQEIADIDDDAVIALKKFYDQKQYEQVASHPLFQEIIQENANLTFILDGDDVLVAQRPSIAEKVTSQFSRIRDPEMQQASAISGKRDEAAILHTAIKGVWGAQTSGANIVSFNDEAYCSFGRTKKDQGLNAPIGKHDEFAYTTALNRLLAKRSRQRMQVGDASTVFWSKEPCDLESDLPLYLAPAKGEEAVSYEKIRSLLSAVRTGIPPEDGEVPFFVLGLAPNASRIAVRFWYDGNVKEIKERIAQHFEDTAIVRAPHDAEYLSLFQLLVATATERKSENIPPNLGGDVARSILTGAAYPRTLLANALRRCKAEQRIDYARAAILKGFLVRNARLAKQTTKEVSMALDREFDNIGYVLGRLFAVLERIQGQAQGGGLNKTIRDTYFGAAASSPLVTFKRLQDLAVHHLAKIRHSGKSAVWLEQLMQEVLGHVPPQGIPPILALEDQGRFAIGYYHQRQEFFTKKDVAATHETEGETI